MQGMKLNSFMHHKGGIANAAVLATACVVSGAWAQPAFDHCFKTVGVASGIDPALLRAIAQVESSMRPSAVNDAHRARTGSEDIGLMQINSRWLPRLQAFGIQREDLFRPCTSIEVGAWILRDLFERHGNSWEAVGAYNAACTQLKGDDCRKARDTYISKVQRAYRSFQGDDATSSAGMAASSVVPRYAARAQGHVQISFSTDVVRHTTEVAALTHDTHDTHTTPKEMQ